MLEKNYNYQVILKYYLPQVPLVPFLPGLVFLLIFILCSRWIKTLGYDFLYGWQLVSTL